MNKLKEFLIKNKEKYVIIGSARVCNNPADKDYAVCLDAIPRELHQHFPEPSKDEYNISLWDVVQVNACDFFICDKPVYENLIKTAELMDEYGEYSEQNDALLQSKDFRAGFYASLMFFLNPSYR